MRSRSPRANHSRGASGAPLRERDDLVDDQLADIERCDGQHRAEEAQRALGERQHAARLPDEPQERRHVAQRANALAERLRHRSGSAARGRSGRDGAAHRIVPGPVAHRERASRAARRALEPRAAFYCMNQPWLTTID